MSPPLIGEFPPSTAVPSLVVRVGEKVTIGGPKSDNFLPDTWMNVYVVPHRVLAGWSPACSANAVHRMQIRSNAKGQLPLTQLWVPDKVRRFDIIVDYDGDGKFSYALDAAPVRFEVRVKK